MVSRLEELRRSHNMTQQKLGDILGLSQQSIHQYEKLTVEPDIYMLKKMADLFLVPVDYLICHDCPDMHIQVSPEELEFIDSIRRLSDSERSFLYRVTGMIARRSLSSTDR